jgi:hypothetical protein
MIEDDREIEAEAVVGRKARPFVAVPDLDRLLDAQEFLGAFCSSIPADCSRNTKGAAEPSMIGSSAASTST